MIILDTNVISEPMKSGPAPRVAEWLDRQNPNGIFVTTTSLAELRVGVELLPEGKRKFGMFLQLESLLEKLFGPRVLSFDAEAAKAYARCVGEARRRGFNVSIADGQIAAVATAMNFPVATGDEAPFKAMGLTVINPWNA